MSAEAADRHNELRTAAVSLEPSEAGGAAGNEAEA